jgi:hypothetical protein
LKQEINLGNRRNIAAVGIVLALAACTRPTPYQAASRSGGEGFTTQQIESNRYRVAFQGNAVTPLQLVDDYLLYRAAETTVENGYDYFVLISQNHERMPASSGGFSLGLGGASFGRGGGGGGGIAIGSGGDDSDYQSAAEVAAYKGAKPADVPNAYDAHEILSRLGPTIVKGKAYP